MHYGTVSVITTGQHDWICMRYLFMIVSNTFNNMSRQHDVITRRLD